MKVRRTGLVLAISVVVALATFAGAAGGAAAAKPAGGKPAGKAFTIGYSAWPGWFPLAVAEEAGIFDEVGLNVKLKYFADYVGSLNAMAAGRLDANTQTLNDTMASVAAGSKQAIVVVNDNSDGNDAIICDESVTSIEDLEGKTIAAEEGVVDHFLLLQGLTSVGLTQDDVDFRGVLTDAAAGAFAGGEFDCVGVFAPFTVQALERPGSHVVFSSKDFPGTIPDHIVVKRSLVKERPKDVQKLVEAWYETLAYIDAHPEESVAIMAEKAELSPAEYEDIAGGTNIFTVDEALTAFEDGGTPSSLRYVARQINPFLVESGLAKEKASLKGLFVPKFTQAYANSVSGS